MSTSEETLYCPKHPTVEATLRCIRCDRPMCTKCLVRTPTGYSCKECARGLEKRFFHGSDRDQYLQAAVCFIGLAVATAILQQTEILYYFLFNLFLAPAIGTGVAEIALRLTERRRARYSDRMGAGAALVGGLIGAFIGAYFLIMGSLGVNDPEMIAAVMDTLLSTIFNIVMTNWRLLIFLGLATASVYARFQVRI